MNMYCVHIYIYMCILGTYIMLDLYVYVVCTHTCGHDESI